MTSCSANGQTLQHFIGFILQANKKTRNRAYNLLVKIGHVYEDEEGGGKDNLLQLFNLVIKAFLLLKHLLNFFVKHA